MPKQTKNYGYVGYTDSKPMLKIISNQKWYVRLYNLITNPFIYILKGIIRY